MKKEQILIKKNTKENKKNKIKIITATTNIQMSDAR